MVRPLAQYIAQYIVTLLWRIILRFFSEMKIAYRRFQDNGGKSACATIQSLSNCINTIPVSTAECERGFSRMNIVCTTLRSSLTVKRLSSLMFVSLTGPPVRLWQPLEYVKSWLSCKRRSAICTQCPKRQDKTSEFDKCLLSVWNKL